MALDTYSGLKAAVADWLWRTDLTDQIPDFITLAEAQMNRRLRTRRNAARATATISSEYVTVPSSFGGPRTMKITGTPDQIVEYVSPENMTNLEAEYYGTSGKPKFYTVMGGEFQFLPAPDSAYTAEMTYWERIPALSDSNTSNWVLADHPDAYLYGSLAQSAPYLKDDERLAGWVAIFGGLLDDINREDAVSAFGGNLNMRPRRVWG